MSDSDSVGNISFDLLLNSVNFQKQVQSAANNAVSKFESSSKNITSKSKILSQNMSNSFAKFVIRIGGLIAAAFSSAVVISFGKECIESAANVQASNSQLAQTFAGIQSKAEKAMLSVAKSSGIVETRLQGVGTSIYAFAKTTGMDSATALSMMQDALQVTADSAAYYDRSLEDTSESLKSFLKGNFENDAALGLSCTETTRNIAANKLYGMSYIKLSESQKQLTLLQMVKDANKLSGAMGQAARESDGWENVIGNLKESWKQFLAVVGQPILQLTVSIIKQITNSLQKLTDYAKIAYNSISNLFGWDNSNSTVNAVSSAASASDDLVNSSAASADNMSDTAKSAEKIKKSLAGFDQLNILSSSDDSSNNSNSSTSASKSSIGTVESDTSSLNKNFDNTLNNLKNKLQKFFKTSGLSDFVQETQNGVAKAVGKIKAGIDKVNFSAIANNFKSIGNSLQPIAKSVLKGTAKVFSSEMGVIGAAVGGTISIAGKSIQTVSGGVAKWLNTDKNKIADYIDNVSGNISQGLDHIAQFTDTMADTAGKSIDRMRPTMENGISNMLSGFTTFTGNINVVLSQGFNIASGTLSKWAKDNQKTLGTVFDNAQNIAAIAMNGIGTAFADVGNAIMNWWNGGGSKLFVDICKVVTDVFTVIANVFNAWIKPMFDVVTSKISEMWNNGVKPLFDKVLSFLTVVGQALMKVWNDYLKPIVNFLVQDLKPVVIGVFTAVWGAISGVFNAIYGLIGGLIETLQGLIEFVTGIFSGDWGKAWQGICDIFKGIFDAIWGIVSGLCSAVAGIFTGLFEIIIGALQTAFDWVVNMFKGIWTTICNIFAPVVSWFTDIFQKAWQGICIVWNGAGNFFKSIWNGITSAFSSCTSWFKNIFDNALNGIKNIWSGTGSFFSSVWNGITSAFSNVTNWFRDTFSAAWQKVKDVFSAGGKIFEGIGNSISKIFTDVVNGIIDGINWVIAQPFNAINSALQKVRDLQIAGWKPFEWVTEIGVPQIPRLAKGGLVSSPTLALVGDNRNAANDPEVVSPLSKLQKMISGESNINGNPEILLWLKKIYDILTSQETTYQNVIYLDSDEIERRLVKVRRKKSRRYGGVEN